MSAPLHPATLAAHLRQKGFRSATRGRAGTCYASGFALASHPLGVSMRHAEPACFLSPGADREDLEALIAALAPDFEVAEDLGSRVVVRRATKGMES